MIFRLLIIVLIVLLFSGCKKGETPSSPGNKPPIVDTSAVTIQIDASHAYQLIYGFGGADIVEWTGDLTPDERIKAFSPETGIGLSIVRLRVPVDSSRFAEAKATVDACKSYGGIAIATVWSAPAWMKTNNSTVGGKLKPSAYGAFAAYLRAFNQAIGGLTAISPTNEPNIQVDYESMQMTASDVADFVAAEGDSCGAPIMAPEPYNMDQTFINAYLNNSDAKAKTKFICGHIYGATPYPLSVDKPVWMTEHFTNSNVSGDDWSNAMQAAKEINDCMNAGWGAYVWWYIRRSYGPIGENGQIQKIGYVMAHYARYVRPGYVRIDCTANTESNIYATAYTNSAKLVVVVINQRHDDIYQRFSLNGAQVTKLIHYYTDASSNFVADSSAVNSQFGIVLPALSVNTIILSHL